MRRTITNPAVTAEALRSGGRYLCPIAGGGRQLGVRWRQVGVHRHGVINIINFPDVDDVFALEL
jgi:hypothetical protein